MGHLCFMLLGPLPGETEKGRVSICQATRVPYVPSCPSRDSGPAFIFSFFSGLLPLGPSRPFLFESFFLPFDLFPEGSVLKKELNLSGCPWVVHQLCLPTMALRSESVCQKQGWLG